MMREDFSENTIPEDPLGRGDTFDDDQLGSGDTIQFDEEESISNDISGSPEQTMFINRKKEALAWLVMIDKLRITRRYSLNEGSTLIGKKTRSDIVIDSDEVSGIHSKIVGDGKNYKIIDMGSTNGTYVNNKKISSQKKLQDNDEIKIANFKFIFKKIK